MAFAAGSRVVIRWSSADFTSPGNKGTLDTPQPPLFGIARTTPTGGTFNVLWDNGLFVDDLETLTVDDIYDVSANTIADFMGRVVRRVASGDPAESNEYDSIVVDLYRRASAAGIELAIIKSITTGTYREIPVANLQVLPSR